MNHKYFLIMTNTGTKNEYDFTFTSFFAKFASDSGKTMTKQKHQIHNLLESSGQSVKSSPFSSHLINLLKTRYRVYLFEMLFMTCGCVMTLTQHYLIKVKVTSSSRIAFIHLSTGRISNLFTAQVVTFFIQIWMININYSRVRN